LSALLLATAALAQEPPSAPPADQSSSPIVVTGRKNMEERIRSFVDTLGAAPGSKQLGRFEVQGVCPAVLGIAEQQQQAVEARMRRVAETVGIPVAAANCTPNVIVVVTNDKRRFIEQLEKKRPSWFVSLSVPAVDRLARDPGPAARWYVEGTLNSDGRDLGVHDYYGQSNVNTTVGGSLITARTRPHFEAAVLVLKIGALEGLTTTQLADYAAMRVFAPTDPSKLDAPFDSTILRILDAPRGTAVPLSLTHWDVGLLKGLYSARENTYARSQKTEIRNQIEEELKKADR
jgi:hypothetical protein